MVADIISQNYISFPGLGIEPFKMDPVLFRIGNTGIEVRWYGVLICIGMLLAFWYATTRAKVEKIKFDDILDMTLFLLIFGIIGARLYYVIFKFDEFVESGNIGKTLYNMVAIWNGGIAIYGAVIAGIITILVFAKVKRMRPAVLVDVAAPAVMIGQILGRWGNFTNSEAYGRETESFIRMGIMKSLDNGETFFSTKYVHPTFLYESLWNLLGFILIAIFYKKKKYHGQIFLMYMTWYGFGRMFIEGLRTDSLYIGSVRVSQLLAGVFFVVGLALLIVNEVKLRKYAPEVAEGDEAAEDDDPEAAGSDDTVVDGEDGAADESDESDDDDRDVEDAGSDDGDDIGE